MNTKHTPGPWTLETVDTQIGICHKVGPFPGSHGRKTGYACIYHDGAINQPSIAASGELYANARLIAAAPELLEACMALREAAVNMRGEFVVKKGVSAKTLARMFAADDAAQSAIAKATGASQ